MVHSRSVQLAIVRLATRSWRALGCASLRLFFASLSIGLAPVEVLAIDRIVFEADEIVSPAVRARGVAASLHLDKDRASARVSAQRATLGSKWGSFSKLLVTCPRILATEPRFGCQRMHFAALGGPTGSISVGTEVVYDSQSGALRARNARFTLDTASIRWPAGFTVQGKLESRADVRLDAKRLNARLNLAGAGLGFSNEDGTIVGEKLAVNLLATVQRSHVSAPFHFAIQLGSDSGQTLTGPVLLDFGANQLSLKAAGSLGGGGILPHTAASARGSAKSVEPASIIDLTELSVSQRELIEARGAGRVRLAQQPMIERARVEITSLRFPAAYTSFLQLALAATDFGTLKTGGTASGSIEVVDNKPTSLAARVQTLDLEDERGKFSMGGLRGELHWTRNNSRPPASYLAWDHGSAYGLEGGKARIDFVTSDRGFVLTDIARLPIFDGAVVVRSLKVAGMGENNLELDFDGIIEPISMPLLSKAFGWPELSGQLAGRIPGLSYRNRELTVDGDLVARVFDGTVVGSGFRLRDPLGRWPRMYADVSARRLDLELVTGTFSVGTITGRLDADIRNLELFDWSPVVFDARLYSTPGDRSPRRISQKAVTSISSVGGGGGGVTAALQSGVLRFFDDFRYDRIGLTCRLRNDVCLMGGIEPAGMGYYIVKGRGLPRIDIVGNAGRVDWPQLVSQIVAGMRSEGPVVR